MIDEQLVYLRVILLLGVLELALHLYQMLFNQLLEPLHAYISCLYILDLFNYSNNHLTHLELPQVPNHSLRIHPSVLLDIPVKYDVLLDEVLVLEEVVLFGVGGELG